MLPRAVRSKGAVSPVILAIARRPPVAIPFFAFAITRIEVLHRLIPRAIEASLMEFGTSFRASVVVFETIGIIIIPRARPPARAE